MTPEGKVKNLVKKLFEKYDYLYYHMPVQSGYGAPSLDFICCHMGRYFAIETKAPGKQLTPRQEITVSGIKAAGGAVFVVDGPESLKEVEQWLN